MKGDARDKRIEELIAIVRAYDNYFGFSPFKDAKKFAEFFVDKEAK